MEEREDREDVYQGPSWFVVGHSRGARRHQQEAELRSFAIKLP